MIYYTGLKSATNTDPALTALKYAMRRDAYLLQTLNLDKISLHPHNDHARIFETTITPFKIKVGTYDLDGEKFPIFAYLVRSRRNPSEIQVYYYIFPREHGTGINIHPFKSSTFATLDEAFTFTDSREDITPITKLYFILHGIELDKRIGFGRKFIDNVRRICTVSARKNETLLQTLEQRNRSDADGAPGGPYHGSQSFSGLPENGSHDRHEPASEFKHVAIPTTNALKREQTSTPEPPATPNGREFEHPNTTSSPQPQPQSLPIRPSIISRNKTNHPTIRPPSHPSHPKIGGAQLHQLFTLPMETAKAKETSMATKLQTAKHRLEEHNAHIEELWALIEEAHQKKLKIGKKVESYERRCEESKQVQRELVERLDRDVRSFIKVARELDIEGEERDVKRVKRG